jgi:hypothetical protein
MQPNPKVNVLLVDDHPENLLALEAILGNLGENLVRAYSGKEALRCLLNQDFAVILLDVLMPEMDGFETATLIRKRERSRHIPIIFLTAFSRSDTLVFRGYSLGAVDYLFKPIEPEILTSKVAVFIDLYKKRAEVKRQAEQLTTINAELKQSEERFRSLSACSPVGIFLSDVEGRCTYSNPRCQAICGFTIQESLGLGWVRFIHPEDRERAIANWKAYTCEGREYSNEYRFQTPEGIIRWTHVRSSPMLSDQGELLGHVGTVEDITERKLAEAARAQVIQEQAARQEAEAANRMKDEFLAILSHELRTPLNSMLGWARLLRTRKFDEATTARALETIERNAKSQAQLIEDILDVSLIIRGKLRLQIRPIHLAPIIEMVLNSVRPAAEAKAIALESVLEPVKVAGDPDRLQQVVWNLLTNAIKFTPEGGKIEVRLEPIGSHAQLRVIDTGVGIAPAFLPYVFDRFRQADSTTTRTHGGLGLGLAIVHHLVELHGGTVTVESDGEGQGAIFTVNLALVEPPLPLSSAEPGSSIESEGEAIASLSDLQLLVVDDDPDTLDFLAAVLQQHGAQVKAVTSVSLALAALEQLQPDVLVSDIGMPETDGYTFLRRVRELEINGNNVPAIALTAYARAEDQAQALSAGFHLHLAKPVEPIELVAAVAKLAGRT